MYFEKLPGCAAGYHRVASKVPLPSPWGSWTRPWGFDPALKVWDSLGPRAAGMSPWERAAVSGSLALSPGWDAAPPRRGSSLPSHTPQAWCFFFQQEARGCGSRGPVGPQPGCCNRLPRAPAQRGPVPGGARPWSRRWSTPACAQTRTGQCLVLYWVRPVPISLLSLGLGDV